MTIRQRIRIELITQNVSVTSLATQLGMSRQLMYHHINRENSEVLSKIEEILKLEKGTFLK